MRKTSNCATTKTWLESSEGMEIRAYVADEKSDTRVVKAPAMALVAAPADTATVFLSN